MTEFSEYSKRYLGFTRVWKIILARQRLSASQKGPFFKELAYRFCDTVARLSDCSVQQTD
jgi:hypothetical protein